MNSQYCNSNALQPDVPVDVELVTKIIDELFKSMNGGKLTRVHFHTLKFHVIATKQGSKWGGQLQVSRNISLFLANQLNFFKYSYFNIYVYF